MGNSTHARLLREKEQMRGGNLVNSEDRKYLAWIATALVLSVGLILASFIVIEGFVKTKPAQNKITVTGSVRKQIKSDLIVWRGSYSVTSPKISEAYNLLKSSSQKVQNYLKNKGIDEKDMVFSSINTITNYVLLPNGQTTTQVESYRLIQTVEVSSIDVDKITVISREATELINEGVEFESMPPDYFYTKIAQLKVDMLGQATKDAKARAEQIASSTGSRIGSLRSAKMGVFQITPLYSNEISDSGVNDISSLNKEITAIVTCDFEIK